MFQRLTNRMESGYLLRDVINLVDGIHFDSSDEIHTLGRLYETLLREIRDAAGDSGEFYTPRPVVRFMVAVTDPQLGETVLDPACRPGSRPTCWSASGCTLSSACLKACLRRTRIFRPT